MFRVELLNIGTELLLGNVLNTHAVYLGKKLTEIGATLTRQACINDARDDILNSLNECTQRADILITTGGLGPTSDDITRDLVSEYFGLKMKLDERALQMIEDRFRRRGRTMLESMKVQAYVPEKSKVLYNQNGTAPGLIIPIETKTCCKWLVMLPGPPRELRPMFEQQVLPWIKEEFKSQLPIIECRVLKVAGVGESVIAEKIEPVLKGLKNLEIGYCARPNEVDIRLFIRGTDATEIRNVADIAEARTREVIENDIFGVGEQTLEEVVVKLLQHRKQTLTTAESCTGGFLAHRITMISGSSDVFKRGFIVYSNDAKASMVGVPGHLIIEHGAVSEPVAKAMAEGALHKAEADYALAVTGIAGPTGGTDEKPVGTVFIALATKKDVVVEKHLYQFDRETFKFVTTQTALNILRKLLSLSK
jgi:nicotinamide-nucleotide amidase